MLIIYGALGIGGIETYFVRIARERARIGLTTKILLQYPEKSNSELLEEIRKYAKVYSYEDVFFFPKLGKVFKLATPIKNDSVKEVLSGVELIHAFQGEDVLLASRFCNSMNINIPISVGFYHYVSYLWGGNNPPYFEKINREFVLKYLPKKLLMMFSKDNIKLHEKIVGGDFSEASTFSIGVIDKKNELFNLAKKVKILRICAVGRLVGFKTYNIHIIKVIRRLISEGYEISLDIYGDGPSRDIVEKEIVKNKMESFINLKGSFDYSSFDNIVSKYDIFIGTGTAIVQSSALGVPSIATIDNSPKADCYGYFYNVADRQYGRIGLDAEREDIYDVIKNYLKLDLISINKIRRKHVDCVDRYIISNSVEEINKLKLIQMPKEKFRKYSTYIYELSRLYNKIIWKFSPKKLSIKQTLPKYISEDK